MATILIIAFLALLLGLLEIFILPGFGIAGIGAIICAVVDVVFIYNEFGALWAFIAIIVAIIVLALMLYIVGHSRSIERLS